MLPIMKILKKSKPTREGSCGRHREGLSNKEIAAEMNVSVNTVMTHRRNITAKLQIHSAAGLTIYAIVSKLVRLDEISTHLPV